MDAPVRPACPLPDVFAELESGALESGALEPAIS